MGMSDKTKRQLVSMAMLFLAVLSLRFDAVGVQVLGIAIGQAMKNQSWGSAFDLALALVTLIYPATSVIGIIVAYVEYVLAVSKD